MPYAPAGGALQMINVGFPFWSLQPSEYEIGYLRLIGVHTAYGTLRGQPRFEALLKRMRLKQ
jgi:hypothetical protein